MVDSPGIPPAGGTYALLWWSLELGELSRCVSDDKLRRNLASARTISDDRALFRPTRDPRTIGGLTRWWRFITAAATTPVWRW